MPRPKFSHGCLDRHTRKLRRQSADTLLGALRHGGSAANASVTRRPRSSFKVADCDLRIPSHFADPRLPFSAGSSSKKYEALANASDSGAQIASACHTVKSYTA